MSVQKIVVAVLVLLIGTNENIFSQVVTKTADLQSAAIKQAASEKVVTAQIQKLAKEKGWPLTIKGNKGRYAVLYGVDSKGYPLYVSTDNLNSAQTTRTTALWAGGSTGLNLSGSSANMSGKLGIWDGGSIRNSHVEMAGRVLQKDNPPTQEDHAIHVAGTLMAKGINPTVKGMAYGLQQLIAYDFTTHLSEMMTEAGNGMLVSNHSYGAIAGWRFNDASNTWEFWGTSNATEDYKFGFYSSEAQVWDSIAYNAPFYLIVKSAGNNRDENGPAVGQPYSRFNASGTMAAAGNRPAGISSNDSYDCISTYGTSKNILTLGAIGPITSGYLRPQDAVMTSYSSWGPTDDGRIKPDVVANGENVLSSVATSDNAYAFFSGTSMCTPNASGSIFLLQEQYSKMHAGAFLRSASLKAIVINTADEAGTDPGPDYRFGWGVINMVRAVGMITNTTNNRIEERTLDNTAPGGTFSTTVVASGQGPLSVTLCWTDPKGAVDGSNPVNNPAKKLINDLDVRVKIGANTYLPWTLSPGSPAAAAVPGDNTLDNVERIDIPDAVPGQTYTIEVTHKGTLDRGSQAFSLVVSGIGGIGYCASNATSTTGGRIDSVSFGTIHKLNPAGCTTYTNYTSITGDIEPSSVMPLYVRVNACDATTANKMVKAYIDFNSDGDFNDAGEEVAASTVAITGNGVFTANVTIPATLTINNYTLMRIVLVETGTAASITPCGTYANGETQDYRIRVVNPSKDLGVVETISPFDGVCATGKQYVTIHIKNFGAAPASSFAVSATVKQGATTIITANETYGGTIDGFGEADYTFQTPFVSLASTAYTITSSANLVGDQNAGNNQNVTTLTTSAPDPAPSGQAEICGTTVFFKTTASQFDQFNWYAAPTGGTPLAVGATGSSNTITADKKYYLAKNDQDLTIGPATKMAFPTGGYNIFQQNYVRFSNDVPFIIENARLYIGTSGTITFTIGKVVATNAGNPSSYQIESEVTLDAVATKPTPPLLPLGTTQDQDPADLGAVYYLGLIVPSTGDHIIIINCTNGASIFRNNQIATNPYPFTVPGVVSITSNSAAVANNPLFSTFWYFFYDMHLSLANCGSARATITASTAVAPVITLNTGTLSSSAATGNQWQLNNNPVAGATGQTFTPSQSGNYKTVVTDDFGCSQTSNEINVTVTGIPNIDPQEIGLKILPNPNNGVFGLQFNMTTKADLTISMYNAVGQEVFKNTYPGFTGRFAKQMQLSSLSHGVYLLRIQHDKKSYLQKVIIR